MKMSYRTRKRLENVTSGKRKLSEISLQQPCLVYHEQRYQNNTCNIVNSICMKQIVFMIALTLFWMGGLARGVLKTGHFTRNRRTAWQLNISIPLPCGMLTSTRRVEISIPQGKGSVF